MPQTRVRQTADGLVRIHVGNAALQAGNAGHNVLCAPLGIFFRHGRVGQALPAESYKVAFPLLNKELRQARVGKAPYHDNRHAHAPFYLRRQIGVEARMDRGGSPHKLVFQMNCTGNVQGIGPAFLKIAGDNACIVDIDAARLLTACGSRTSRQTHLGACWCAEK